MIGKIHYQITYRMIVITIFIELMNLDILQNGMKLISLIIYLLGIVRLEKYSKNLGILHL
nr:MAG TPA: hypothetical protein [Caudoviricetes sp.]